MGHNYAASIQRVLMASTPEERQREEDKLLVLEAVKVACLCKYSGRILDMGTAVLLDGEDTLEVLAPEVWDHIKDTEPVQNLLIEKNLRVIDARELYA